MVFSSILFILYFLPLFLLTYFLVPRVLKNVVILGGSVFFYAWGAPRFVFVVLATTAIDYFVVRTMYGCTEARKKKLLLYTSLCINVGLLFYFKYSHFFIGNVNYALHQLGVRPMPWLSVVLPIGISFFTFETITYVVDVYRGIHKPLKNFWDYQLYIMLFPKMIAGPIIRFHDFATQVYDHHLYDTTDNRLRGFYRFSIGLGKKVFIANVMAASAEVIFKLPVNTLSTPTAWMGALSYTFQIYFDFSGYSDMAIGLALMMGFRIPENFNNPYSATSITDFWRRWHISLGSWMREYLYIPLGGNRVATKRRLFFNLWLVFLLSGLWHGAAWGYVIWGAYHGLFLIIERVGLQKVLTRLGKLSILYTFPVVLVGWVFFKLEHLHPAMAFLGRMFSWQGNNFAWQPDREHFTFLVIAIMASLFTITKVGERLQQKILFQDHSLRMHVTMTLSMLMLFILSAARIDSSSFNPFIYFRF